MLKLSKLTFLVIFKELMLNLNFWVGSHDIKGKKGVACILYGINSI